MFRSGKILIPSAVLFLLGLPSALCEDLVSVFGQKAPRSIAKKFEIINDLVNQNKFKDAEPLTIELLNDSPNLGALHWTYAKILYNKKDYRNAYLHSKKAVSLLPRFSSPYICLANSALALGKQTESLAALKTFLKLDPASPQAKDVETFARVVEQEMKVSTMSKIKSPPDTYLSRVTAYGVTRFTEEKMPLKVFIGDGGNVKGFRPGLKELLKESFNQWQEKTDNLVRFKYVDKAGEADIECYWTDDLSKMDISTERGRARYTDSEFGRVCAEILILTRINGVDETDIEIKRTALHEIGHALGLNGHSDSKEDIMFITVEIAPRLSNRDIQTLKALYKLAPTEAKANDSFATKNIAFARGEKHQAALLCQEAIRLLDDKKFKPAVDKFRQAIKIDPGFQAAYYNLSVALNGLGVVTARGGDLKLAESYLKEACELMTKYGEKRSQLSIFLKNYIIILKAAGKNEEAETVNNRLKEIEEKSS